MTPLQNESPPGHIMEIFSAIQGEGPWVGVPQIFLRLFRCNLRCAWCDTPESFASTGKGKLESPPESRRFRPFDNPVSPGGTLKLLGPFLRRPHHSISFTGGEPLMQHQFLKSILPVLRQRGERIFFETGGSLPEILQELIEEVDIVSMDFKLPSSAGERPLWKKHEDFLRIAAQKEVCVKIVVTKDTGEDELERAFSLIKKTAPRTPVILQPVTPVNGKLPPSEIRLLHWHEMAFKFLRDVRVIPQTHKVMRQK